MSYVLRGVNPVKVHPVWLYKTTLFRIPFTINWKKQKNRLQMF